MGYSYRVILLNCVLVTSLLLLVGCFKQSTEEQSVKHHFEAERGTDWNSGIGVRVSIPPSSAPGKAELVVKKLAPEESGEGTIAFYSTYDISLAPKDLPPVTLSFKIPEGIDPRSAVILEWTSEGWLPAESKEGLPGGEVSPDGKYISILREHLSKFAVGEWLLDKLLKALEKVPELPPCPPKIQRGKTEWLRPNHIATQVTIESPNVIPWEFPSVGSLGIGGTWYEVKIEPEEYAERRSAHFGLAPGEKKEVMLAFPGAGAKAVVCLDTQGAFPRAVLNWASRLGLPVSELDSFWKIIEHFRGRQAGFKDLIWGVKELLLHIFWEKAGAKAKFAVNLIPVSVEMGIYISAIILANCSHYCEEITPQVEIPLPAPTNLQVIAISPTRIDLTWTTASPTRVAGYKIYRNASYITSITETSYSDTSLAPATKYCYTVSAYDVAGNESARSSETCTSTPAQLPAPPDVIGTYICHTPGSPQKQIESGTIGLFDKGDRLELRGDGTALFLDPWPIYLGVLTGKWSMEGNEIEIALSFFEGTVPPLKARVEGDAITFADGSVWMKMPPVTAGPEVRVTGVYICDKATEAEPRFLPLVFEKGDVLKLAERGALELTDPKGGPTVTGEWEVKGERIVLTFSFFGLLIRREGKASAGTLTLTDGSAWVLIEHVPSKEAAPNEGMPSSVVRRFWEAIEQGNYSEAMGYVFEEASGTGIFGKDISLVEKYEILSSHRDEFLRRGGIQEIEIPEEEIEGDLAHVQCVIKFQDGTSEKMEVTLLRIRNEWKIAKVRGVA